MDALTRYARVVLADEAFRATLDGLAAEVRGACDEFRLQHRGLLERLAIDDREDVLVAVLAGWIVASCTGSPGTQRDFDVARLLLIAANAAAESVKLDAELYARGVH
jgi:hypothetical protein